ncbi:MAG TPA: glycosyltransferase family 2 protein [Firmicutes bacterium]|nr:glycosyltransferase family 2 protein [Bacillota bacterium]HHY97989.1 glycosyltransferase family 2 protein [Bacillota bacterium]
MVCQTYSQARTLDNRDFTVSVVIPAYNESRTIGSTVAAVISTGLANEVIVVDDGSTDDTARRAEDSGARVIRLEQNKGKGYAMTVGVKSSTSEFVALLDGDLGDSAKGFTKLLEPIIAGQADLCIASLPSMGKGGGFGAAKGLGRFGIWALTGYKASSPLSGQRAARKEDLLRILPFASRWGVEVGMTIDALRIGLRVIEVETDMRHRVTGKSLPHSLHRLRQFRDIALAILFRLFPRRRS